jgi:hypothetical protein
MATDVSSSPLSSFTTAETLNFVFSELAVWDDELALVTGNRDADDMVAEKTRISGHR